MSNFRGSAVTGNHVELTHPDLELAGPFTSHVDVRFRGVVHQVLSMASLAGHDLENVTGRFSVRGLDGLLVETIDTVATQAVRRHQAIVTTDFGTLSTHSYDGADLLLELIGALRPAATDLGVIMQPDVEVEVLEPARLTTQTALGVLEVSPLAGTVVDGLPDWAGTPVSGGELFSASRADGAPTLALVTETCRVVLLVGEGIEPDAATSTMAELGARWLP